MGLPDRDRGGCFSSIASSMVCAGAAWEGPMDAVRERGAIRSTHDASENGACADRSWDTPAQHLCRYAHRDVPQLDRADIHGARLSAR